MKKFNIESIICIILILLVSFSCSQQQDAEDTSQTELGQFFDTYYQEYLSRHPMLQTKIGSKDNYYLWDDFSDEAELDEIAILKTKLAELKKFDFDQLSDEEKQSYEVFEFYANNKISGEPYIRHNYPVNQFNGLQTEIPAFLIQYHSIVNESDAHAYIQRVKGIQQVTDQIISKLKAREKMGITPPEFVFDLVQGNCNNLLSGIPFEESNSKSPIYNDFIIKLDRLNISQNKKKNLIEQIKEALTNEFKNGYTSLLAYWGELENKAEGNEGIWSIPNGKEYYQYALQAATTSNLTPEEIKKLGENEVALIQYEMTEIMSELGFKESTLQDFFDYIKSNSDFVYNNDKEGRSAFLKRSQEVLTEIREKTGELFITVPSAKLEIKAVEGFREATANLAFSEPPAPDGSKPGVYYVNLHDMNLMPKYMLQALAYHEGIPGLHLQRSYVQEYSKLPDFRIHLVSIEAYTEGWGLYSEFLPKLIGLYEDPYSDFGRLSLELFRACRLVVDVGLHHEGWNRQQAIDYLEKNTPLVKGDILREVDRYIVNPAQATSYYIGMNKIIELRDLSSNELGEGFDIKEFHDVVLRNGALPLDILEQNVKTWIEETTKTAKL